MSQELADRLAVAAGWRFTSDEGWRGPKRSLPLGCHPFPPGRTDPILDLMRERGLALDFLHRWDTHCMAGVITMPRTTASRYFTAQGPDLWTALASAVLAAMEKNA